jgi:hypothetical protein
VIKSDLINRFGPLKPNYFNNGNSTANGNTYSGLSSPNETEKNDNGRLLPQETKASSNDESSVEYGKKFLPPVWVDLQEEIESHL